MLYSRTSKIKKISRIKPMEGTTMSDGIEDGSLAWKIEADARSGLTFSEYRRQLIHETTDISDFFNEFGDDRFIISAPKGSGKTLLLIAKRMQIDERTRSSIRTLQFDTNNPAGPAAATGNEIVDRPSGIFPFISKERMESLKADYGYWKSLWKLAIMASIVKGQCDQAQKQLKIPKDAPELLQQIFEPVSNFKSATTIFVSLFTAAHPEQIECLRHTDAISRSFQQIRAPTFLFIDNVDEYFKPALEQRAVDSQSPHETHYRARDNAIWTLAQLGLVGAAYEFHKVNSHIKVYCTIRREAFAQISVHEDLSMQIRGHTIEIDYQHRDFRAIFDKNVGLLPRSRLAEWDAPDPLIRFFGRANTQLKHRHIDRAENPFEFMLRHTFYRPRDLMALGAAITKIPPKERSWEAIRKQTDQASNDVVHDLRGEMRPFFALPSLEGLARNVPSNVMDRSQLRQVTDAYLQEADLQDASDHEKSHPFCVLYKVGMVGRVRRTPGQPTQAVQEFMKPRDITMKNEVGLPATEEYYLIHPALDDFMAHHSKMGYLKNFHSQNIIGAELPWFEPTSAHFVVKGDVCGFSKIMQSEYYERLSGRMHEWASDTCADVEYYEVSGGDSIVIIDKSPERVIGAARQFLQRAAAHAELPVTLRFGGAAGPIAFRDISRRVNGMPEKITVPMGLALRTSARLEPCAPPGCILIEDEFHRLSHARVFPTRMLTSVDADIGEFVFNPVSRQFNIQKNSSDPAYETALWIIRLDGG
jgi:hypothetical protein